MKMISEVQEGRILGFRFARGVLGLSTGVSVVVLRGCMAPDDLPPWGVRVVIGIVVLIDGVLESTILGFQDPFESLCSRRSDAASSERKSLRIH